MKSIIITFIFLSSIHVYAQRDFKIDTTFKPSECVRIINNMAADPEGGLIFTHLAFVNPCYPFYEHQFLRMAKVDIHTGQYDFNFATPFPGSSYRGNVKNIKSKIYLVSEALTSGSESPDWIHKIDVHGTRDSTWFPLGDFRGKVFDMIEKDDYYLIAGSRIRTLLQPENNIENNTLFKFDKNYVRDTTFRIEATYKIGDSLYINHKTAIRHLIPFINGFLIVGGFFTVNDFISPWIAYIDEFGHIDTTFKNNEIIGSSVNDWYVTEDSKIILSGNFIIDVMGEDIQSCLIRLNSDGSLDATFNNSYNIFDNTKPILLDQEIFDMVVVTRDTIILVGWFEEFQGKRRDGIVMTDGNGFLIEEYFEDVGFTGWGQNDSTRSQVRSIIQVGVDTFLVGGSFRRFGGIFHPDIIKIYKPKLTDTQVSSVQNYRFSILPNPASDRVHIYSDDHTLPRAYPLQIGITDMTGRRVWTGSLEHNQKEIDTGFLPSGTYMLQVRGVDGRTGVQKLVIMR